ncbi:unnamed protein product [Rotaria magnacalcarata]|uniref:Uncharacterized protein n=1 Tax=Rotaria magnacalcarata TaxID=392030 RepID=A0A816LGW3_9BILA|nr:unnamed protein product [Rotaria magnacalcarata]CAF1334622.1 unnamed protein product [Rotaria magnacalcarata]CAF1912992.1 unnamed protein product [Rotaria magnacalcarata]CAF1931473.1 unnamed protein product [Rotaria magnacalcarata]CAF2072179.1 unnamed protein product [Rotaria magnacalcarata]
MYRIVCSLCFVLAIILYSTEATPLDDYVNTPDIHFAWQRLKTYAFPTYKLYILNMTSQKWFDASFSSQPIWWHHMIITVPRVLRRSQIAFLFIDGGDNTDPIPTSSVVTALALSTGSVAVELKQVPNQPMRFMADPTQQSRTEDAIIAWTWKIFIEQNGTNPYILLRMPMTKAAVRAMDTTEQLLKQEGFPVPQNFVVAGLSKRGWTTWTTAAVNNQRVLAAVPIVLDILNLQKNMMHHYRSLAGWTFVFKDYHELNITRYLNNPNLQKLATIVDPYSYFDRYAQVKLFQLQGANDEFFLPDSEDYFWDDLQVKTGGSYLRRIPNTGHNIQGYQESLQSFYLSIADKQILPSFKWTRTINETHGQILAVVDFSSGQPKPINVTAYQARTVTGTKRDFRQAKLDPDTGKVISNPVVWLNMPVQVETQTSTSITYSYTAPLPPNGYWDGMFIQVTFPGRESTTLDLTTETLTLPNTFPVEPCTGDDCYGTLC